MDVGASPGVCSAFTSASASVLIVMGAGESRRRTREGARGCKRNEWCERMVASGVSANTFGEQAFSWLKWYFDGTGHGGVVKGC